MGEQRTRFLSTSEVVYKVKSDMSMSCYFILWKGEAVVKGIKEEREGRRHAQLHEIDRPNFSHRYLFLRNAHYSIGTLSGIFISHSRVGRSTVYGKRTVALARTNLSKKFRTLRNNRMPSAATDSVFVSFLLVCFSHTSVSPEATSFNLVLPHISGSPSDY